LVALGTRIRGARAREGTRMSEEGKLVVDFVVCLFFCFFDEYKFLDWQKDEVSSCGRRRGLTFEVRRRSRRRRRRRRRRGRRRKKVKKRERKKKKVEKKRKKKKKKKKTSWPLLLPCLLLLQLLPPASCLLPPASCLLPPASCLLPPAFRLLPRLTLLSFLKSFFFFFFFFFFSFSFITLLNSFGGGLKHHRSDAVEGITRVEEPQQKKPEDEEAHLRIEGLGA